MARQKFTLSAFRFINIPVKLTKISKEIESRFKELHVNCGNRLGRKTWCNTCNVEVPSEDKGKGIVFTEDQEKPIPFSKEEIASLYPTDIPNATIEVVNIIDPLGFRWLKGSHYILKPEGNNPNFTTPYNLLLNALETNGKVALVRWFDSRNVYVAVLNSHGIVSTLFWGDEVDTEADVIVESIADAKLNSLMNNLIKKASKPFNPVKDLVDDFREAVAKKALEKQDTGTFTQDTQKAEPKANATQNVESLLEQALAEFGAFDNPVAEENLQATGTEGKPLKAKKSKK